MSNEFVAYEWVEVYRPTIKFMVQVRRKQGDDWDDYAGYSRSDDAVIAAQHSQEIDPKSDYRVVEARKLTAERENENE